MFDAIEVWEDEGGACVSDPRESCVECGGDERTCVCDSSLQPACDYGGECVDRAGWWLFQIWTDDYGRERVGQRRPMCDQHARDWVDEIAPGQAAITRIV